MEDPYQIGKHVEVLLRRDAFEHALLFTQQASKNKKVVVAWNHLISYLFTKNEFKKAIKTYNEVSGGRCRTQGKSTQQLTELSYR